MIERRRGHRGEDGEDVGRKVRDDRTPKAVIFFFVYEYVVMSTWSQIVHVEPFTDCYRLKGLKRYVTTHFMPP